MSTHILSPVCCTWIKLVQFVMICFFIEDYIRFVSLQGEQNCVSDTNSDLADNATVWQLLKVLLLRQSMLSFVFPVVALHEDDMTYVLPL